MSSIFTFDPSPPHPESPWNRPSNGNGVTSGSHGGSHSHPHTTGTTSSTTTTTHKLTTTTTTTTTSTNPATALPSTILTPSTTSLQPEPQSGPIEYKLHLLRSGKTAARLSQLTTQLHWRLQQSNPCLSALQESQGALYELGVNDDGEFVGLLEEEVEESLDTLREMAGRLGCGVWVRQRVHVGEWREGKLVSGRGGEKDGRERREDREDMGRRRGGKGGDLWVVEAFVRPIVVGEEEGREEGEGIARGERIQGGDGLDHTSQSQSLSTSSPSLIHRGGGPSAISSAFSSRAYLSTSPGGSPTPFSLTPQQSTTPQPQPQPPTHPTEQLKIALTGATTAGKSTLLGTLTTSQLDNGRGKSRLSLLRHRHELASGVTSSVAQELIGYRGYNAVKAAQGGGEVVNYSTGNVSSWTDVHSACTGSGGVGGGGGGGGGGDDGITSSNSDDEEDEDTTYPDHKPRVIFLSDTAGHPRFRRTTIRSLLGWAPHYALLIVPGDEDSLSEASRTHLDLVLKLGLRMVVAISKIDGARREGLRNVYREVLEAVREGGRNPVAIMVGAREEMGGEGGKGGVGSWSGVVEGKVRGVVEKMRQEEHEAGEGEGGKTVPVLFVSSVSGAGVGVLHSLLRSLPIPRMDTGGGGSGGTTGGEVVGGVTLNPTTTATTSSTATSTQPPLPAPTITTLFHTEEVYALPASYTFSTTAATSSALRSGAGSFGSVSGTALSTSLGVGGGGGGTGAASIPRSISMMDMLYSNVSRGAILSGHLRYGTVALGDELFVGPFPTSSTAGSVAGAVNITPGKARRRGRSRREARDGRDVGGNGNVVGGGGGKLGGAVGDVLTPPAVARLIVSGSDDSDSDCGSGRAVQAMGIDDAGEGDAGEEQEWKLVKVVSLRRLRLPVGAIGPGDAATVGVVVIPNYLVGGVSPSGLGGSGGGAGGGAFLPRKGMVMVQANPAAGLRGYSTVECAFPRGSPIVGVLAQAKRVGSTVVVYCASVRAAARVVDVEGDGEVETETEEEVFGLRFVRGTEWVEAGARVLVVVDLVGGGEDGGGVGGEVTAGGGGGAEMAGVGVGRVMKGVV